MERKLLWTHKDNVDGHKYSIEFWAGEVAQVHLISYPTDAMETLALATKGYTGRYEPEPMDDDEILQHFDDLKNTKLGTPAEMLNFVFLVRDVPRSWTHQAVRNRIGAAVVQESTRFIGAKDVYKVLVPKTMHSLAGDVYMAYKTGIIESIRAYEEALIIPGIKLEDARNLLPHAVLTHMYWSITLKTLMNIYAVRWCCQAEPSSWIPVMRQMKSWIRRSCGEEVANFLSAPIDRGESCGFNASFDRACVWKKR